MPTRSILKQALTPAIPVLCWSFSLIFDPQAMRGLYFARSFVGYRALAKAPWRQKVLGFNRSTPWPITENALVNNYARPHVHPDDLSLTFRRLAATTRTSMLTSTLAGVRT